jgi:solute carrier family 35, member E3
LAIVSSAFCAFVLNLSMYLVLGRSSALTYNVIGLSKLFLVLSLNYWFFESSIAPNLMNLLGVFLAFSGVCSFSFVKFKLLIKDNNQKIN